MQVPKDILDIIYSNKTSLGDNPALPPDLDDKFLVFLVDNYYNEITSHFDGIDIEELSRELNDTITECKRIENDNKEALERLSSDLINEIFNIPNDTIELNLELVNEIDTKQQRIMPENSEEFSFDSIEDMHSLTAEIYKRRFLNALIYGASIYYASNVNAYADSLYHINPRLISLYKKILHINELLMFHMTEGGSKQTDGGKVDVYMSNSETPVRIETQGIMFPILLEEGIRGLLELSIAHGLPETAQKANYVMGKSDFKLAEIWDQRLGVPLWKRLVKLMSNVGEDPIDLGLNFIFMEISKLHTKHFNAVMREMLADTKSGKSFFKDVANKIRHNKEQDEFDDYMTQQSNNNQYPLNDEEFTSDELINDDLCSTTILDETE